MCRVICILSVADESSDVCIHAAASGESSAIGYYVVFSLIENWQGGFTFVKTGKSLAPVPCGRGGECHKAVQIETLLPVPPGPVAGGPACLCSPLFPSFISQKPPIAQSHRQPMEFFVWNRKQHPSFQADARSLAGAEPGKQMVPLSTLGKQISPLPLALP